MRRGKTRTLGRTEHLMPSSEFLAAVHARTARVAVGPSAVRRQGEGCAKAAREFFEALDLARFPTTSGTTFSTTLDQVTHELQAALPKKSRSWGLSRKLLNIFLRDALYTTYLRDAYALNRIEALLEVPLDSITAGHIKRGAGRGALPAWPGVKHLQQTLSDRLQSAAKAQAQLHGVARVHLDTFWWGQRKSAA